MILGLFGNEVVYGAVNMCGCGLIIVDFVVLLLLFFCCLLGFKVVVDWFVFVGWLLVVVVVFREDFCFNVFEWEGVLVVWLLVDFFIIFWLILLIFVEGLLIVLLVIGVRSSKNKLFVKKIRFCLFCIFFYFYFLNFWYIC